MDPCPEIATCTDRERDGSNKKRRMCMSCGSDECGAKAPNTNVFGDLKKAYIPLLARVGFAPSITIIKTIFKAFNRLARSLRQDINVEETELHAFQSKRHSIIHSIFRAAISSRQINGNAHAEFRISWCLLLCLGQRAPSYSFHKS